MSVRQLLITDPTNPNYGKISENYIPSSIHPAYSTQTGMAKFSELDFNNLPALPITGDDTAGYSQVNYVSDPVAISSNFNFGASKYMITLCGFFNFISSVDTTPTWLNHAQLCGIQINGLNTQIFADDATGYQLFPSISDNTSGNHRNFYQFSLTDYIVGPISGSTITLSFKLDLGVDFTALSGSCDEIRMSVALTPCL